jgi:hypothetical protein
MKRLLLWSGLAALVVGGLAGMSQAVPDWAEDSGVDFWNLSRLNQQLETQARRTEDLDARFESTFSRIEMRQRVLDQLLAGQMSLREGAVKFREFTQAVPKHVELVKSQYPNMSEDEMYCRYVLDYAWKHSGFPKEPTPALMRLHDEFEGTFPHSGAVHWSH